MKNVVEWQSVKFEVGGLNCEPISRGAVECKLRGNDVSQCKPKSATLSRTRTRTSRFTYL